MNMNLVNEVTKTQLKKTFLICAPVRQSKFLSVSMKVKRAVFRCLKVSSRKKSVAESTKALLSASFPAALV